MDWLVTDITTTGKVAPEGKDPPPRRVRRFRRPGTRAQGSDPLADDDYDSGEILVLCREESKFINAVALGGLMTE